MKRTLFAALSLTALLLTAALALSSARAGAQGAAGDDWKLAMKPYSLGIKPLTMTFFQSLDKTAELGMKYIEAKPGDIIGGGLKGTMDFKMDLATQDKILEKCKQTGLQIKGYGVARPTTDDECRTMFEFCKHMGVEYIVMEPPLKQLDLLDKLANQYNMSIAIHNHPQPSVYWNPETVLNAIKGHSKRIGACADTGHWARSGLDPVECLKKLDGHIIMLHYKDLNTFGDLKAYDVEWGTGVCKATKMMAELRRQNFKGYFSIEYEHPQTCLENLPKIVAFFNKCKGLSAVELDAIPLPAPAK